MNAKIGIPAKENKQIAEKLTTLLADQHVLYVKTRNFHWNVTGPNFTSLHLLFEGHYTQMALDIDMVAERIRTLGQPAIGTMKEFLSLATLKEAGKGKHKADEMVSNLLADHEAIVTSMRKLIEEASNTKDEGTVDMLTGLMEQHEKTAWMLRSYLE